MEVAAAISRQKAALAHHLADDEIGVFFISPCAAKVTSVKAPFAKEKSHVDGVLPMQDVFLKVIAVLENDPEACTLEQAGFEGIRWASSGGESLALGNDRYLAVDGIHNVLTILESIENDRLEEVDFVEVLACYGGCLGGPLTVENAFVAKTRLKKHIDQARKSDLPTVVPSHDELLWTLDIEHRPVMKLDDDLDKAMKKLEALETINDSLPGLDCGACGAPNCRALAEDIVRGMAHETDCIFVLREKIRALAAEMMELEAKMPPVLDREKTNGTGKTGIGGDASDGG